MRLFEINNDAKVKYIFFQELSDDYGIDIYTFDQNKKELDGGVLESDIDVETNEAILEVFDYMGIDIPNVTYVELNNELMADFDW